MYSKIILTSVLTIASQICFAQQSFVGTSDSTPLPQPVVLPTPKPPVNTEKPLTGRWLDLTTFSHSERYRNQYSDNGYHYSENG